MYRNNLPPIEPMLAPASTSSKLNRKKLILAALILTGFGARVWGISYGLPYLYHPDKPMGAGVALHMLKTGDLNLSVSP